MKAEKETEQRSSLDRCSELLGRVLTVSKVELNDAERRYVKDRDARRKSLLKARQTKQQQSAARTRRKP